MVVTGVTVTLVPLRLPGFHTYDVAPLAVMFAEFPAHTSVSPEAVTDGFGFTVTATVDVLVQPFASVPVTVYVVDVAGESVTDAPLRLPGCQE